MAETILSVKELSIGYDTKAVANNINFKLEQGGLCAIVGVNGIGKSTLLRTIAGLQRPLSGAVTIRDTELSQFRSAQLAKEIAVVLTDPIATKNLTVIELVALGRQPYTNWLGQLSAKDQEAVEACLQTFELLPLKNQKCFELSDGQLQRVLIAKAMAQDTPLIILDEPTTHLDLAHKVAIFKALQQLAHAHGKTIVFTTHEINLAIQLCDFTLLLNGQDNPFGSPCELIEKGCFSKLFPEDVVTFDAKSGVFRVIK